MLNERSAQGLGSGLLQGRLNAPFQAGRQSVGSPGAAFLPAPGLEARGLLVQEARSLLTRLERVKSFALYETMVPAAAASLAAQNAMERYMARSKKDLHEMVSAYLRWLDSPAGKRTPVEEAQRRFALLRMRFNVILSQFDIFADVVTQRSENETGVWLAGLDVVAADALALPGFYEAPPLVCYLDRGHGAAIRRARTRLPGGGKNPVAIIRVPRERMVGSGIASSLVHEVGHQGAALLDLVDSLRRELRARQALPEEPSDQEPVWPYWERWISEILSDFWSAAKVGIAAPMGLMGVVSLPRAFVFRVSLDDPHPMPWIRVKLSCAMGAALYPHPQWQRLSEIWEAYYPTAGLDTPRRQLLDALEAGIPEFVELLANHRPQSLYGKSLREALTSADRSPARLRAAFEAWRNHQLDLRSLPPSLVFAIVGQARADGKISPEGESRLVADLLAQWALRSTLNTSEVCEAGQNELRPALVV